MIPASNRPVPDVRDLDALLDFDRELAAGANPPAISPDNPFLHPVHECQRLLEAVWPRSSPPSSFELPQEFGRFSIVRELGRGGFGVVFLAEDSMLGRRVALKVPRPEVLVTPEFRRRFLREAEAASRLDHPHIVPVYEVGEEGPACFIASAYCEGLTLAQWLQTQTKPVPVRVASRLVAVLAAAVAHAHERGILHRDLKPGNILLQEREGNALALGGSSEELGFLPRICDFGLAKLLDQVSEETRSGVPIGSPAYMAPEQASGRLREHGPGTDIYALGVILYELLTGRPPHRGETDLETLRMICDLDPPSPRALRPNLPRDLERIVLKCLEKRPSRRYASAWELTADLHRFFDGKPVHARPISMLARAGKWGRRRPMHAALAMMVGVGVLAILAVLGWKRVRDDDYRSVVDRSRQSEADAQSHRTLAQRQSVLLDRYNAPERLHDAALQIERREFESAASVLDALRPSEGQPDLRGFAWHHLYRRVGIHASLPHLPARVRALACAADGRTIALADETNRTFLMDRVTGTTRELPGKRKLSHCVRLVFSSDGRSLASLSHPVTRQDGPQSEVKLWDLSSGQELEGIAEFRGFCYQIVFSANGEKLVTIEAAPTNPEAPLRAWKISEDRKRATLEYSLSGKELKAHLSPERRSVVSSDGSFRFCDLLAMTPGEDSIIAVWLETGEIRLYMAGSGYCTAVCRVEGPEVVFIPRTDHLVPYDKAMVDAIGRSACTLTGSTRARPIRQDAAILLARISHDGRTALVQERDPAHIEGELRLLNVATGSIVADSPWGELWHCLALEYAPAEDLVLAAGPDNDVRIWDFNRSLAPAALKGHKKEVWGLAFSPDSRTLVSSSDDGTLKLWDVASGREQKTLTGHVSLVTAVAYSPDGHLLASAGWDSKIRLWSASGGKLLATLSGHFCHVRSLAFSPHGDIIASGGDDETVRIWEVASRRELTPPITGHAGTVYSVAFAPDGMTLFSGAGDETIRLWNWNEGRLLAAWRADDEVYALACSPDGRILAAAHPRGTIRLWDVAEQRAGAFLHTHAGDVLNLAFTPDGRTLASCSRDRTVRLWDPITGQELLTLKGHEADVHGIAFSRDGTILATGSYDGAIKLWRTSPEYLARKTYLPGSYRGQ